MCKSDPQIAVVVTLMMASRGLTITGRARSRRESSICPPSRRLASSLLRGSCRSWNLTRFEQPFEASQVFTNHLRWLATDERRDDGAGFPRRRGVLEVHADLCAAAASNRVKLDRAGGHD